MDDDACIMKLIEITPVDNYRDCSESSDITLSPCHIKVCMIIVLCAQLHDLLECC